PDVQVVAQVGVRPGEPGIDAGPDDHVRVTWRAAGRRAGHSPPAQPQRGSLRDAARDADGDLVLLHHLPAAVAGAAGLVDDLSPATAGRAGGYLPDHHRATTAGRGLLAGSVAVRAGTRS